MRFSAAVLLSIAATALASPITPPPERACSADLGLEYNQCGSACPLTCDEPSSRVCTLQCVQGCFCKKGLVLNKDGNCVAVDECPKPQA